MGKMNDAFKSVCNYSVRLFLMSLIAVSVYAVNASGETYSYDSTMPSQLYYFNSPYGVVVDGSGNVYVADTSNHRIQKYDSNGVYASTLGVSGVYGADNSHFYSPYGVAVDGSGNLYVADQANQRIQKYNSSGAYASTLGVTGVSGTDNSHFKFPMGVAVDGSGNFYVDRKSVV